MLFPTYFAARLPGIWDAAQEQSASESEHPLVRWLAELPAFVAEFEARGIVSNVEVPGQLTANIRSVIALALDMYWLDRNNQLQDSLVERIVDPVRFQAARFELAVAATWTREGFEIVYENESDPSRKHPEFVASYPRSKIRAAVEAKSIHRMGILGSKEGNPPPTSDTVNAKRIAWQIANRVQKSLRKANGLPLFVFVDLNLPTNVADEVAPAVLKEIELLLPRIDSGFDENGMLVGKALNLLTVSNWAFHVGKTPHQGGDILNMFINPTPKDCRYSDGSVFVDRIKSAIKNYGTIPLDVMGY